MIEQGFINSAVNLELVEEGQTVALLLDESASMGSMQKSPFYHGKVMMAAMLSGLSNVNTIGLTWATTTRQVNFTSPMDFVSTARANGGGTNLGQAIDVLIANQYVADVVVIFTDMQENNIGNYWGSNGRTFAQMRKEYMKINPSAKFIFWNLEGYGGATPMKLSHNVLEVSGFSEKMLELIPLVMKDKDAIIKQIMAL